MLFRKIKSHDFQKPQVRTGCVRRGYKRPDQPLQPTSRQLCSTAENMSASFRITTSQSNCQQWNLKLPVKSKKKKPTPSRLSNHLGCPSTSKQNSNFWNASPPPLPAPWCLWLCPVHSPGSPSSPSYSPDPGTKSGRLHPSSRLSGSPRWWPSPATSSLLLCPEQPAASSDLEEETIWRNRPNPQLRWQTALTTLTKS